MHTVTRALLIVGMALFFGAQVWAEDNRDVTLLGPEGPAAHGRKWALVIGCNGYDPQQVGQLKVAVQDAKRMRNCLLRAAGFPRENVILITDEGIESVALKDESVRPTYTTLQGRIADFCAQHQESDVLLIYFAGHGFHSQSARKDYLAPLDVQRSALDKTAIAVDDVLDHLKASGARQGVLIADACRNVVGRALPGDEVGVGDQSLEAASARGVWYLSSCRPGQVSMEDEKLDGGGGCIPTASLKASRGTLMARAQWDCVMVLLQCAKHMRTLSNR